MLLMICVIVTFFAPYYRCLSTLVQQKTAQTRAQDALPQVTCTVRRIRAVFGQAVLHNLRVKDRYGVSVPVPKAKEHCGVRRGEKNGALSFQSRYDSCYTQVAGDTVVVSLRVQLDAGDQWYRVNISCPLLKKMAQKPIIGRTSCSLDGHFVFSVKATDTDPLLNPNNLAVKGQPQCSPVATSADTAVFKIGVRECGTKMMVNGDVVSYEVEVEELHPKITGKHSPFSLQVQCQYEGSALLHTDLWSLNLTNPPPVTALGTVRVQMRIATDESFTSFLPEDQLPLTLYLRKPVYVEVSITPPSPDPSLSLRVRDCFAYPASRHSVWTLLYDGCPNPLDSMRSSVPVDSQGKTTSHSQVRRFDVKTFSFLDPETGNPSVEEVYFYCWVEICTEEEECKQHCSITSPDGERERRESGSDRVSQLVSFGPMLLGQNTSGQEQNHSDHLNIAFQVSMCSVTVICTSILFFLLFSSWSMSCHVAEVKENVEMETRNDETGQQVEQAQ
ncbi:zona pellucida sperm-binding protein 2-like isoform X2 [Salmo trutta]|uniref:zona pellucida sperm-binding protein 2-like isoform X2 n=1 Tax=Salmo trutta TaxID=8032 RepID=UPI0011309C8F|nr:zona pellucida sperm-binding protein 2-like isoform X2 [Salmo trutta]